MMNTPSRDDTETPEEPRQLLSDVRLNRGIIIPAAKVLQDYPCGPLGPWPLPGEGS